MGTTIDEKVVSMKFDHKQFEEGIKSSMNWLDKLEEKLNFNKITSNIMSFSEKLNRVDTTPFENAIDTVRIKISALDVMTGVVFGNIAQSLVNTVKRLSSVSFGQIISGGKRRALNIAQAQFQVEGLGYAFEKVSDQINNAVSGTAYGYDAAAKAASQLLASNVKVGNSIEIFTNKTKTATKTLDSMEIALTAVSGVAAMTNSSYEDIADIFTTVAGNGRLMTDQLNRLSARGLNAAATLAEVMGVTEGEVRELTSKGQIDFQKFSEAMYTAFAEHAKDADNTFQGVTSNIRAALSRIGQPFASSVYSNMIKPLQGVKAALNQIITNLKPYTVKFEEFMKVVSTVGTNIMKIIGDMLKPVENIYKKGKGRTDMIYSALDKIGTGLKNLFINFLRITNVIKQAYSRVFNKKGVTLLNEFADTFEAISEKVMLSKDSLNVIGNVFLSVFKTIKIGIKLVKKFIKSLSPLIPLVNRILKLTATVTSVVLNLIDKIGEIIYESGLLEGVFKGIAIGIGVIITAIEKLASVVLGNFGIGGITGAIENSKNKFVDFFTVIGSLVKGFVAIIAGAFYGTIKIIQTIVDGVARIVKAFYGVITSFNKSLNEFLGKGFTGTASLVSTIITAVDKAIRHFDTTVAQIGQTLKHTALAERIASIKNSFVELNESLKITAASIVDKVKSFAISLKDHIVLISTSIIDFVKNIDLSKVILVAYIAMIGAMTKKVMDLIGSITNLNNQLAGLAKNMGNALKILVTNLSKPKSELPAVTAFIIALAGSLFLLSIIPLNSLIAATTALGTLAITMAILASAFSKAKKTNINDYIKPMIKLVLSLSASILLLAEAFDIVGRTEIKDITQFIIEILAIFDILLLMAESSKILAKSGVADVLGVNTIVKMAASVLLLAEALKRVSELKLQNTNFKDISLALLELSGAISLLSAVNVKPKGLMVMISSLYILTAAIKNLNGLTNANVEEAKSIVLGMTAIMGLFALLEDALSIVFSSIPAKGGKLALNGLFLEMTLAFAIILSLQDMIKMTDLKTFASGIIMFKLLSKFVTSYAVFIGLVSIFAPAAVVNLKNMTKALFNLTIFVGMLIPLVYLSGKLIQNNPSTALIGVGACILQLYLVLTVISSFSGMTAVEISLKTLIGLSVLLSTLCVNLLIFGQFSPTTLIKGGLAIAGLTIAIKTIIQSLNGLGKIDSALAKTLLNLNLIVTTLVGAFSVMQFLDTSTMLVSATTLALTIKTIFESLKVFKGSNQLSPNMAKTVAIMIGVIAAMGTVLTTMAKFGKSESMILTAGAAITGALYVIFNLITKLNALKKPNPGVQSLLLMSIGIIVSIGGVIAIISALNLNGKQATEAMKSMGIAILGYSAMLYSISKLPPLHFTQIRNIFLLMIGSIGYFLAFAASLQLLSNLKVDSNTVNAVSKALFSAMLAVAGGMVVVKKAKIDINSIKNTALLLTESVAVIAGMGLALKAFKGLNLQNVSTFSSMLIPFIELIGFIVGITKVLGSNTSKSLAQVGVMLLTLAGSVGAIYVFAKACAALETVNWDIIKQAVPVIVSLLGAMALISSLLSAGGGIALGTFAALTGSLSLLAAVSPLASKAFDEFSDALNKLDDVDYDRIASGIERMGTAIANFAKESLSASIKFAVSGLLMGTLGNLGIASLAGGTLAASYLGGFYKGVGQHSPWKSTTDSINFAAQGLKQGTIQNEVAVRESGSELGETFVKGYDEELQGGMTNVTLEGLKAPMNLSTNPTVVQNLQKSGKNVAASQYNGYVSSDNTLASATNDDLNTIPQVADSHASNLKKVGYNSAGYMTNSYAAVAVAGTTEATGEAMNAIADVTMDAAPSLGEAFAALGGALVSYLGDGFIKGLGSLGSKIGGAFNTVLANGSSKLAGKANMQWLYEWSDFFQENADIWTATANSLSNEAQPSFDKLADAVANVGKAASTSFKEFTGLSSFSFDDLNTDDLFNAEAIENITDSISENLESLNADFGTTGTGVEGFTSSLEDAVGSMDDFEETTLQTVDVFEEFDKSVEKTTDNVLENMASQIEGTLEWSKGMMLLAKRGASVDLLKALGDQGVNSYELVNALVQGSDSQLKKANELFAKSLLLPDASNDMIQAAYALAGDESAKAYMDELGYTMDGLQNEAEELGARVGEGLVSGVTSEKITKAGTAIEETFNNIYDSVSNSISIFDKFDQSIDMNSDDILENMQSNLDGVEQWSKNLNTLAKRGISKGLLQELTNLGPQGYEKVNAFTEMTSKELKRANKLYSKSLKLPEKTTGEVLSSYAIAGDEAAQDFISQLGANYKNFKQCGKMISAGLVEGIQEDTQEVSNESKDLGNNVLISLQDSLEIHSPSRKTIEIGKFICAGLTQGIKSNSDSPLKAIEEMGKKIAEQARETLGVHSPSKEFMDIAKYVVQGFSVGIQQYSNIATTKVKSFTDNIKESCRTSLKSIAAEVLSDIDGITTISPVFDLSNIQAGAKQLKSILGSDNLSEVNASIKSSRLDKSAKEITSDKLSNILGNKLTTALAGMSDQDTNVNVTVTLAGDARKMLKVLKYENDLEKARTGNGYI